MDLTDILTDELEGEHCDDAWHERRYREMVRDQIIAGQPVNIDTVPLKLFESRSVPLYGKERRYRDRHPYPDYPVLTDLQIVTFLQRLSPAELDRLRVRMGMTGAA